MIATWGISWDGVWRTVRLLQSECWLVAHDKHYKAYLGFRRVPHLHREMHSAISFTVFLNPEVDSQGLITWRSDEKLHWQPTSFKGPRLLPSSKPIRQPGITKSGGSKAFQPLWNLVNPNFWGSLRGRVHKMSAEGSIDDMFISAKRPYMAAVQIAAGCYVLLSTAW